MVESLEEKKNHIIAKKWKRQEDGRTREAAQWLRALAAHAEGLSLAPRGGSPTLVISVPRDPLPPLISGGVAHRSGYIQICPSRALKQKPNFPRP